MRKKLPLPRYNRQQEASHQKTYWQATYHVCRYNRICQWYDTEGQVLTSRTAEDEERIYLEPEQLTIIRQKQARGDSVLQITEHHETLFDGSSEPAAFTNESGMDGNSSALLCRGLSESRNSPNSRLQADRDDHVKVRAVTVIEVFKSAGTLVIEVQVPSQQPGTLKSWMRISQGIEQYARHFVPTETDHQHLEAASLQQSIPRVSGGHSPVSKKLRQSPSFYQYGFSQRVRKSITSKSSDQKGL